MGRSNQWQKLLYTPVKIDPVDRLPRELVYSIFSFLTPLALSRASQVSRSWQAIADDDDVWKIFIDAGADEKAKKADSLKDFFREYPEFRRLKYLGNDEAGCRLYTSYLSQAQQHFETIKQSKHWDKWQEKKYVATFQILHKGHPLITRTIDILCEAPHVGNNDAGHYVKAFNYLYEQEALNQTTIPYIAACVGDKSLIKQFHVEEYAYFIALFYRAGILNDDNIAAVKRAADPDVVFAKALSLLLGALRNEANTHQKQQRFALYRDRLVALSKTCKTASLITYAECMINLYTNGICLSFPDHAVIYDELFMLNAVAADSYSYAFVRLHKANLLLGPGCKLLRDLILKNPIKQHTWRAKEIILNYQHNKLWLYVVQELEKLHIDPDSVSKELDALPEIDYDTSDDDSGIAATQVSDNVGSPFNKSLLEPRFWAFLKGASLRTQPDVVVENTVPPKANIISTENKPLTSNEKTFKDELLQMFPEECADNFLNAVKYDGTNHSFKIVKDFLLKKCISREIFLNREYGAAAIAIYNKHYQLALFIRIVAEMDKLLYENNLSLIKRLPTDDRAQAADTYLHTVYRSEVSSAIGDYLQKTSPNKDDHEKLSKALEKAMERFCYNTENLLKENSAVRSLAQDRTWQSQMRRRVMMVIVNVALVLSVFGIAAIIYRHRKYGCTFFGATHSKQMLYHMKKKVLHDVTEFSSQQSKAFLAA